MKEAWHKRSRHHTRQPPSAATQNGSAPSAQPPDEAAEGGSKRRVLVLGGTGRVGASTVASLLKVRDSLAFASERATSLLLGS